MRKCSVLNTYNTVFERECFALFSFTGYKNYKKDLQGRLNTLQIHFLLLAANNLL